MAYIFFSPSAFFWGWGERLFLLYLLSREPHFSLHIGLYWSSQGLKPSIVPSAHNLLPSGICGSHIHTPQCLLLPSVASSLKSKQGCHFYLISKSGKTDTSPSGSLQTSQNVAKVFLLWFFQPKGVN